jgi:hypothetical protein
MALALVDFSEACWHSFSPRGSNDAIRNVSATLALSCSPRTSLFTPSSWCHSSPCELTFLLAGERCQGESTSADRGQVPSGHYKIVMAGKGALYGRSVLPLGSMCFSWCDGCHQCQESSFGLELQSTCLACVSFLASMECSFNMKPYRVQALSSWHTHWPHSCSSANTPVEYASACDARHCHLLVSYSLMWLQAFANDLTEARSNGGILSAGDGGR